MTASHQCSKEAGHRDTSLVHFRTTAQGSKPCLITHSRANLALTLTKFVLRTKDLIFMLLDGLDVFLGVCVGCPATPAIFKWPGEHIYIGLQVELAVCNCWQKSASASELPVKRRRNFRSLTATEVAVGLLTQLQRLQRPSDEPMLWASVQPITTATGLAVGLFSSADVIAPTRCTDALPVQPVLKAWLLRNLHRLWNTVHRLHQCPFLDTRFNRCFTCFFT